MSTDTKYTITRLNASNYFNWRFRIEMLLKEKGIWNVINENQPATVTTEWSKADEKALSTICLLIDDDQIQHVRNAKNAKEAWMALKNFHEINTPGNKVRVLREIMRQRADENTDMELHVNHMNELCQQLLALDSELKPEFIMSATLLGSLPSSYDPLITALEARSDGELTSTLVRSKIIEEFRRRKERDNGGQNESSALKITNTGAQKKVVTCYFCKRNGHRRDKCEDYKKWKSQRAGIPERANIVNHTENFDEMLFMCRTELSCLVKNVNNWIMDSGATCHVTCKRENFIEFDERHSESIAVANGQHVKACGKGKVSIGFVNSDGVITRVTIENVLYVPSIGTNLISVKRLTAMGFIVGFRGKLCKIQTGDGKREIAFGDINGDLYGMRIANQVNVVEQIQEQCVHQWHRILGHRDIAVVRKLASGDLVMGMKLKGCGSECNQSVDCVTCIEGKMTRLPFPSESTNRSANILDLIHSDICGPMQTKTGSGNRYLLTFIDDFSRYSTIIY